MKSNLKVDESQGSSKQSSATESRQRELGFPEETDNQRKNRLAGERLQRSADRRAGLATLSEQIEAALLDRHNGTRGEPLKCDCPFCGMPGKGRWSGKKLNFKCPACSRRNSDPKCKAHIKAMGEKMPPSKSFYGYRELAKQLGVSEKQQQPESPAIDGLLKFHPAADIFPLMQGADFDGLVKDIRNNQQQVPISLYEGKIIDGRNRYRACVQLGIEPIVSKLDEDENDCPVQYVLSLNLHRRHLNASQRAMVAARAKDYYADQAKKRMLAGKKSDPSANLHQGNGKANEQAGAVVHVSGSSVAHASNVLKHGSNELIKAVDSGEVSVSKAAKMVLDVPKKHQAKVLAERKTAKPTKAAKPRPAGEIKGAKFTKLVEAATKLHDLLDCPSLEVSTYEVKVVAEQILKIVTEAA